MEVALLPIFLSLLFTFMLLVSVGVLLVAATFCSVYVLTYQMATDLRDDSITNDFSGFILQVALLVGFVAFLSFVLAVSWQWFMSGFIMSLVLMWFYYP